MVHDDPITIIKIRYAKGEIGKDEYIHMLALLKSIPSEQPLPNNGVDLSKSLQYHNNGSEDIPDEINLSSIYSGFDLKESDLQNSTKTADELYQEALTFFKANQINESINLFQAVIKRDPSHASAWNGLGVSYQKVGNSTNAQNALEIAVNLNPSNERFKKNLESVRKKAESEKRISSQNQKVDEIVQPHKELGIICTKCKTENNPKLKHCSTCGEKLNLSDDEDQEGKEHEYNTNWILFILLYLPFAFLIFSIALQNARYFNALFGLLVLVTVIIINVDARKISAGKNPEKSGYLSRTPDSWSVYVFFFWPIILPYYLLTRQGIFYYNYGYS